MDGVSISYRCCERCQPCRIGTGTKMTIALRPWPTSICKIPGISEKPPSAHRLFEQIESSHCVTLRLPHGKALHIAPSLSGWCAVFLILPRVRKRTAAASGHPSCPGCWSRAHRVRSRSVSRFRRALITLISTSLEQDKGQAIGLRHDNVLERDGLLGAILQLGRRTRQRTFRESGYVLRSTHLLSAC